MAEDIVISVKGLVKEYELYDKNIDQLKEIFSVTRKKYHHEFRALDDINFEVQKGEQLGIIGTNGSGKSTLLKIITGVVAPTAGEIHINGKISALLELGAGFNPNYTGMQNIYLNGSVMGYDHNEMESRVNQIVEFADIGDFINQPVKNYSSGMFARLAFAVAISVEPEILIVDEALSVGDVFFQTKCYKKFEEFKKRGKTILFVSHDLGSINKYCDRVMLLNRGKKLAEGTPKEMINLYKRVLVGQEKTLDNDQESGTDLSVQKKEQANQEWKSSLLLNSKPEEYGTLQGKIVDFGIFDADGNCTNVILKGSDYSIKMRIKFFDEIKDPIYAIGIKDIKGTTITGTNSMYEKIDTGIVHDGDGYEVCYSQHMSLIGGQYLLSLGLTGFVEGKLVVYHRLYDVCNINVLSDKPADGFYDQYSSFVINKTS